ncbi:MAG: ABC transporter ATP-binding protein [Acidimicrobiales bacterium]|nr:ABC transporter ATP-binding protein [Acidimicrobiales bacterium]
MATFTGELHDDAVVDSVFRRGTRLIGRSLKIAPIPHAVAISGAVVFAIAAVALTRVLGWATDEIIEPGLDGDGVTNAQLLGAVLVIMAVGIVRGMGALVRRYYLAKAEYATQLEWRRQLFDQYLELPVAFHQSRPTGELLAHVDADVLTATSVLKPLAFAVGTIALVVASFGSLLDVHPYLALVALVLFPLLAIINQVYTRKVEAPSARVQALIGDVTNIAHESFDGVLVVKTLGREEAEIDRFEAAADRLRNERIIVGRLRALFEPAIDALPNVGIVALLLIGVWLVDQGSVTVGDVVGSMALFTILAMPMRIVGFFLEEMPRSVVALDRVDRVLTEPRPVRHGARREKLPAGPLGVEYLAIALDYGDQRILNDVDMTIAPGESVAIVGSTGSGKSTIARLLVDLDVPALGQVRVGGVPVADLDPAELQRAVAMVFQETYLFAASVADNIALGRDVSRAEVLEAARLAGAADFITAMPDGYDTIVGERGITLSGGQRQRVALARALVGRPRVMFLDDATSAVDPVIEAQILDNLRSAGDLTLLVVAHRLSTIKLADRVVFISGGTVVATGSHTELLARPDYAALVRAYEEGSL